MANPMPTAEPVTSASLFSSCWFIVKWNRRLVWSDAGGGEMFQKRLGRGFGRCEVSRCAENLTWGRRFSANHASSPVMTHHHPNAFGSKAGAQIYM